jgi:hypothetical protein
MHTARTAPGNSFAQDAPLRADLVPSPEPWVQAEIDRLRDRNRTLADTLASQVDELKALRLVLRDLKAAGAQPASEALALVSLDRGLCSQCWRSAIPACACPR